jgi:hypothetical protein
MVYEAPPNKKSEDQHMNEAFDRPLKTVTVEQLEVAIAEAITKLLGKKYEAEITEMDFNPGNMADTLDCVACKLTLSKLFKS